MSSNVIETRSVWRNGTTLVPMRSNRKRMGAFGQGPHSLLLQGKKKMFYALRTGVALAILEVTWELVGLFLMKGCVHGI